MTPKNSAETDVGRATEPRRLFLDRDGLAQREFTRTDQPHDGDHRQPPNTRRPLRTSCLINNFNYAHFLPDAVDSALNQTTPFDEIIVVDDGSTDESLALLRERYGQNPRLKIISQANGGQLAAFNTGYQAATGDILFFLDADDRYYPRHVEEMLNAYYDDPRLDFVFCASRLFGNESREQQPFTRNMDFGETAVLTYFRLAWIGGPTSCLAIRRPLLDRFLPLENTEDWRIRADDCLVYGSGIAGGRKRYVNRCLVQYRVHENNCHYGKPIRPVEDAARQAALLRLRRSLLARLGLTPDALAQSIVSEFLAIPEPTLRQCRHYLQLAAKHLPLGSARSSQIATILRRQWLQGKDREIWSSQLALIALAGWHGCWDLSTIFRLA